jgi:hypothetical protein
MATVIHSNFTRPIVLKLEQKLVRHAVASGMFRDVAPLLSETVYLPTDQVQINPGPNTLTAHDETVMLQWLLANANHNFVTNNLLVHVS